MAALGGAAGAGMATLVDKFIGSINIDKWRFKRDHKGREKFLKV